MKIRGLYDGGIFILVGIFLIAIGIVSVGTGITKANKESENKQKEADKAFILSLPLKKDDKSEAEKKSSTIYSEKPTIEYVPSDKTESPKEDDMHYEVILPADEPKTESQADKPWWWPF